MTQFGPAPPNDAVTRERDIRQETTNTRERVRTVVLGLQEPAAAATVAERAQCSANAARTHLEEFVELGVVKKREHAAGAQYVRNEAYVYWRRANELAASHTIEELLEKCADLEATHADIEAQLGTLSEWATVREAIDRHKEAIRIARRSDRQLTI